MALSGFGTSNYLLFGSAPATSAPITISVWGRRTTAATSGLICDIGNTANTTDYFRLNINTTGNLVARANSSLANGSSTTSTTISENTWFHVCALFTASNSRDCYLNGGGNVNNATSVTPSGVNNVSVGITGGSTKTSPFPGELAEVAIWKTNLTSSEITALASGVCPLKIRPAQLVFYAPLITSAALQNFLSTGLSLTGSLSDALHPRVFKTKRSTKGITAANWISGSGIDCSLALGTSQLIYIISWSGFGTYLNWSEGNQIPNIQGVGIPLEIVIGDHSIPIITGEGLPLTIVIGDHYLVDKFLLPNSVGSGSIILPSGTTISNEDGIILEDILPLQQKINVNRTIVFSDFLKVGHITGSNYTAPTLTSYVTPVDQVSLGSYLVDLIVVNDEITGTKVLETKDTVAINTTLEVTVDLTNSISDPLTINQGLIGWVETLTNVSKYQPY